MMFRVIHRQTSHNAQSPVRVVEQTTGREVGWINRYLDREYVRRLAEAACASMLTTCCTLSAGGRVFITRMPLRQMSSPNQHSWSMCASSPANNLALPVPPSMPV